MYTIDRLVLQSLFDRKYPALYGRDVSNNKLQAQVAPDRMKCAGQSDCALFFKRLCYPPRQRSSDDSCSRCGNIAFSQTNDAATKATQLTVNVSADFELSRPKLTLRSKPVELQSYGSNGVWISHYNLSLGDWEVVTPFIYYDGA